MSEYSPLPSNNNSQINLITGVSFGRRCLVPWAIVFCLAGFFFVYSYVYTEYVPRTLVTSSSFAAISPQSQPWSQPNSTATSPIDLATNLTSTLRPSSQLQTLLVVVLSARSNFEQRQAIRSTWASAKSARQLLKRDIFLDGPFFVIGDSETSSNSGSSSSTHVKYSEEETHRLRQEYAQNNDMVFCEMDDTFRSLTRKMRCALEFIQKQSQNYKKGSYVLKADDDAYINANFIAQELLSTHKEAAIDNNFYCYVIKGAAIVRDSNSKLYVSHKLLGGSIYPDYCSGIAYIFRTSLAAPILAEAKRQQALPNEDTFYTGTIAATLGLGHTYIGPASPFNGAGKWNVEDLCAMRNASNPAFTVVVHRLTPREMKVMHRCDGGNFAD